jgi:hypothetical protein
MVDCQAALLSQQNGAVGLAERKQLARVQVGRLGNIGGPDQVRLAGDLTQDGHRQSQKVGAPDQGRADFLLVGPGLVERQFVENAQRLVLLFHAVQRTLWFAAVGHRVVIAVLHRWLSVFPSG